MNCHYFISFFLCVFSKEKLGFSYVPKQKNICDWLNWSNGKTSDFQSENIGSIPVLSIKNIITSVKKGLSALPRDIANEIAA